MRQWEQPKLIILTRGQPEERILSACKTIDGASASPVVSDYQCDLILLGPCEGPCSALADS